MKPFLYSLSVLLFLSPLLWARPVATTNGDRPSPARSAVLSMPKQCQPGKTSPAAMGWRLRAEKPVKVFYLKGSFNRAELEALSRGVNNWNTALREIDSPVTFLNGGELETVSVEGATVTVVRGIPRGKERVGEIRFFTKPNGSVRMTVVVSPTVTDLSALTSLMTHELGHAMGLADCYECKRGTTAMSAFKGKNKGNDVYEPSACDKYVVATGYATDNGEQARLTPLKQK